MRRFLEWLQPAGAYAWRWLGGIPPQGAPRTGAGRPALRADAARPGRPTPPPGPAPPLPGRIVAEIGWDLRELRTEWHEALVRRALGRELREVELAVLAEHDAGEDGD
jgi:hypothetical protein